MTDYLGTPAQMYDKFGIRVWDCTLDIYGKVRKFEGTKYAPTTCDCPFRYQGQYEDAETGLYYNRFRYYSPDMGMYLSQDPIGLAGNNPTLYGYVFNTSLEVDVFGLKCSVPVKIDTGKQGKHIVGHNNYIEGRSILSADAQDLLNNFHNGNIVSSRVISDNKIKVDFGVNIGAVLPDGSQTTSGIIHMGNGGAHIVPALPDIF